jgi:uridine kinase
MTDNKKQLFVIMSFNNKYDQVYHQSIKQAASKCGYECIRADDRPGPGNIPSEIIKSILGAPIVLADISEPSPNVFYELGVSHCTGNKTITITSNIDQTPFDIAAYRAIRYTSSTDGLRLLAVDIENAIRSLEAGGLDFPNNLPQEAGRDFFDLKSRILQELAGIEQQRRRVTAFAEFLNKGVTLHDNNNAADAVAAQIYRQLPGDHGCRLASITGPGAIGKSTFSQRVATRFRERYGERISIDVLPTDSYVLSRAERIAKNIIGSNPKSHRLDKMTEDVQRLIVSREPVEVTPYDHSTGGYLPERTVHPSDVILLEGVYSFLPALSPLNRGLKYYIYADKDKAKELKFIADCTVRGYDIQTAFAHAEAEYQSYELHILPLLRLADYIIEVDEYWQYLPPKPQSLPSYLA